ncbi:glycine hydroxymethyltransferase [Tanacetum coccineum]
MKDARYTQFGMWLKYDTATVLVSECVRESDSFTGSESVMPNTTNLAAISVNVQSLSSHERIMALDLPYGGHISHGYQTHTKKKIMQEGQKDDNLNFVKLLR